MVPFYKLLQCGMELMIQTDLSYRLAVVKIITDDYRHRMSVKYQRAIRNKSSLTTFSISDIKTIVSTITVWGIDTRNTYPIAKLIRYVGAPISIRFSEIKSRNIFVTEFDKWLQDVGVKVDRLDWL